MTIRRKARRRDQDSIQRSCTCSVSQQTRSNKSRTRSSTPRSSPAAARVGRGIVVASTLAFSAACAPHASASPVNGGGGKGNKRRGEDEGMKAWSSHTSALQSSYLSSQYPFDIARPGKALEEDSSSSRVVVIDRLLLPASHLPAQREAGQRTGNGQGKAINIQQPRQHSKRQSRGSNTPKGVPSHYEFVDGQWVPTDDWALNGIQGPVSDPSNEEEGGQGGEAGGGSGVVQHTSLEHDGGAASSTTLGWAKSTNAVLGVDIDTSLPPHATGITSPSSSPASESHAFETDDGSDQEGGNNINNDDDNNNNSAITTRSNLATLTDTAPSSSSSLSSSQYTTSLPRSTTSSTSTTSRPSSSGSSNTVGTAYDFSRDVPNGWVSDGRTAAYAVPVIIGLSVFLACLIFGLIITLLRMNNARKSRRKAVGQLKLSEEGKSPTRPPSITSSQNNGNNDEDDNGSNDSSSIEEEKRRARKRIGRKWTPNLNTGNLRRRKNKIAHLFKRDDPALADAVIVVDGPNSPVDTNVNTVAGQIQGQDLPRLGQANGSSSSVSLARNRSYDDDEGGAALTLHVSHGTNPLSRTSSHYSSMSDRESGHTAGEPVDGGNAYGRPPSIRINTATSLAEVNEGSSSSGPGTSSNNRSSLDTGVSSAGTARQDEGLNLEDHHAVPVPQIGPPAYIQPPPIPAYSRGPTGQSSSTAAATRSSTADSNGYASTLSTPGLSASMDEKRVLLGGVANGSTAGASSSSSSDAFAAQRQYEHLYASREGENARVEQMTGAPSASASTSTVIAEEIRRAQEEADEARRRELQQSLAGHVAISDKELLGRLRSAASAPVAANQDSTVGPSVPTAAPSSSSSFSIQNASAPSIEDTEEVELQEHLDTTTAHTASVFAPSSAPSFLPAPPTLFAPSALDRIPQVDEKTRLRNLEEQQAAEEYSSHPPGLDESNSTAIGSAPSAPPVSEWNEFGGHSTFVPSAPAFDIGSDESEAADEGPAPASSAPSAPPMDSPLDGDASTANEMVAIDNRPHREGIV